MKPSHLSNKRDADEDVGVPREDAAGNADVLVGDTHRGWYSRGYLPHRDEPQLLQSITFRLADSLPQEKLRLLKAELTGLSEDLRETTKRQKTEQWLDAGMGCCALRYSTVARCVQDAFLRFHGERYHLHAWCIMPNHVHVLVEPIIGLASIVQGWKSFTARFMLAHNSELELGIHGHSVWMREYWDRFIRNENHYRKTVDYIHCNPVKAGLCKSPGEWRWSSAHPGNADVPVGEYLV